MRVAPLLAVLVACGPGTRDPSSGLDAAPSADAPPKPDAAWSETREASGAIAGAHRVLWTQSREYCGLPLRCIGPVGPTLSMRDFATGVVSTLIHDATGADSLAGDEDEVFMVLGTLENVYLEQYVARYRPGISTAPEPVSAPTMGGVLLLFVDPTYVYWQVGNTGAVYRASRTGDGSDATIIATASFVPSFAFGGYYWSGRYRVPIAGGAVEELSSIDVSFPIATADGIYAAKAVDDNTWSVGVLGTDDVYHPVLAAVPKEIRPGELVVDGDELFWKRNLTLYRAHAGDSMISTGPAGAGVSVFAVTADEILYNFTRNGYDTAPR